MNKFYIKLADFLYHTGVCKSKGEAKRLISQNAIKIHRVDNKNNILNTEKINDMYTRLIFKSEEKELYLKHENS